MSKNKQVNPGPKYTVIWYETSADALRTQEFLNIDDACSHIASLQLNRYEVCLFRGGSQVDFSIETAKVVCVAGLGTFTHKEVPKLPIIKEK